MLYDFRPTGWKMTIILLQQPAINRAEEYTERRAERALQCEASARVYAESRARMQVNTFAAGCKQDDVQTPVVRTRFPYNRAAESLARGRVRVRNESTQRGEQRGRSVTAD